MTKFTVNNCPDYAKKYKYILCRKVNGEYWFYGAWDDFYKVQDVCAYIDGIILLRDDCDI